MVVIATAVATINSAASVSAVTASVVTVAALTVLAVHKAEQPYWHVFSRSLAVVINITESCDWF